MPEAASDTDLALLQALPVPRPDFICDRYAGRVSPIWGFFVYGVLYFFLAFVVGALGMMPGFLLGAAVGAKGAWWAQLLGFTGGGLAFIAAWIPFARWVKRRRSSARPLIRDGELTVGHVFDPWSASKLRGLRMLVTDLVLRRFGVNTYRIEVVENGRSYMLHAPRPAFRTPKKGAAVRVLLHPKSSHALIFDDDGKATVVYKR